MTPVAFIPARSPSADALGDERVVHRMTLPGVSWALYEQLLRLAGNGLPRMTYDRGLLELEMPSKTHEALKWIVGRYVEAFAEERGIDFEAAGSTTWRLAAIEGGLEAEESYYIQNYARARLSEIDLAVDPPPDLAIEIDLSPPDIEKTSIYARLGVPEIWRWRDNRLAVLERQPVGDYAERPKSLALPDFPLDALATVLRAYPQTEPARSVAQFRRRLREHGA